MASNPAAKRPAPQVPRDQIAFDDIKLLFEDAKFRRFLSTLREFSGTERAAIGSEERSIHYTEGRRHFWCDVLFQVSQAAGPDALIRILEAELDTQKGTSSARTPYDRLALDDGTAGGSNRGSAGVEYLDYAQPAAGSSTNPAR